MTGAMMTMIGGSEWAKDSAKDERNLQMPIREQFYF